MTKDKKITKGLLLEGIETARRQLERYIFYFEQDQVSGQFSASERLKFGKEEMIQSGVWGEWSLKDLMAYVIDSEQRLTALLDGREGGAIASPLLSGVGWEDRLNPEEVPQAISDAALNDVLVNFSLSHQAMVTRLQRLPEVILLKGGLYAWTGENAVADYVQLLTIDLYDWVKGLVRTWKKRHQGEQLSKDVILERIRSERLRLEKNLGAIPREGMEVSGVVGAWSLKDLLAHLVEWERMFTGWYQAGVRGEVPAVPAPGYTWAEMDALNEAIFQKHHDRALEEVLEDFGSSYRQIYALVESMPEEEIFTSGRFKWMGKGNLVGYILANTASHYRWAKDKVREWRKSIK